MTVLWMIVILLLLAMVIIHDRRMSEIEQRQEGAYAQGRTISPQAWTALFLKH